MSGLSSMTLGKKIAALSVLLMTCMVSIGFVGYINATRLTKEINTFSEVITPSLRYATLVDMMHDGLRSVVYQAMYASGGTDDELKKSVLADLEDFTKQTHEYVEKLQKLENEESVAKALKDAIPELESYLQGASAIVKIAVVENNREKAQVELPKFNELFSKLEKSLEAFGDLIQKQSDEGKLQANKTEKSAHFYILLAIVIGGVVGGFISMLVAKSSTKVLGGVINELNNGMTSIQQAAADMATAAKSLSDSISTQASSLQQTAASVEEISSMVTRTAENSEQSNRYAVSNQKSANEGKSEMDRLVRSVKDIENGNLELLTTVGQNNQKFGEVVQIIANISQKTKVINDIVFQTKLLAFNASVEAARAGEHGKGFAVVAQEVSNLASMSGNAAKEIADMLGDSVTRVESIIEGSRTQLEHIVQNAKSNVQNCMNSAEKCKTVLDDAVSNSASVSSSVEEISQASREQAKGVQEISQAVTEIDKTTQQTSKVVLEVNESSQSLETQAAQLQNSIQALERMVA